MKKIFIDGSAGTTGLRIFERLSSRTDITLLTLPEEERKDPGFARTRVEYGGHCHPVPTRCGGAGGGIPD